MKRIKNNFLKPENVFLIIALVIGTAFALLVPAGGGLDEANHIARSYAVAHGEVFATEIGKKQLEADDQGSHEPKDLTLYGGFVDKNLMEVATTNLVRTQSPDKYHWTFPTWKDPNAGASKRIHSGVVPVAYSNTAVNSPFSYLPFSFGYWIGRITNSNAYAVILIMRLLGLITAVLIVFFSIKVIPIGKWIVMAVSLTPVMIAEFATVTADTLTYAVCIAFISWLLKLLESHLVCSRKDWIILGLLSLALSTVKLSYVPLLGLLVLLPIVRTEYRRLQEIMKLICIFLVAGTLFLVWYVQIKDINTGAIFGSGAYPSEQKALIPSHPGIFLKAFISQLVSNNIFNLGGFGVVDVHSTLRSAGWLSALGLILSFRGVDSRESVSRELQKKSLVTLLFFVADFILISFLISLALYLQFTPVGTEQILGVQSRYYAPIVLLLLLPPLIFMYNPQTSRFDVTDDELITLRKRNALLSNATIIGTQILVASLSLWVLADSLYF